MHSYTLCSRFIFHDVVHILFFRDDMREKIYLVLRIVLSVCKESTTENTGDALEEDSSWLGGLGNIKREKDTFYRFI